MVSDQAGITLETAALDGNQVNQVLGQQASTGTRPSSVFFFFKEEMRQITGRFPPADCNHSVAVAPFLLGTLMQLQEVTVPTEVALQNMGQEQVSGMQLQSAQVSPTGTKRPFDSDSILPVQEDPTNMLMGGDGSHQQMDQQHLHHEMTSLQMGQQAGGDLQVLNVEGQPVKRACVGNSAGISQMSSGQDNAAGQIDQSHQMNVSEHGLFL